MTTEADVGEKLTPILHYLGDGVRDSKLLLQVAAGYLRFRGLTRSPSGYNALGWRSGISEKLPRLACAIELYTFGIPSAPVSRLWKTSQIPRHS